MIYDAALVKCGSYDGAGVEDALNEALRKTGGLDFVRAGMLVAVKVNLVAAAAPERAATVHPAVVCALVKLLRERGADVLIGDSPGGLYTAAFVNHIYDVCGMKQAEALGAKLNDDFSQKQADNPQAVQAKQFTYTAYLDKADAIIDLCKLKSHGMMGMSNAVKNFFGTVPGTMKPEYHYKYPRSEDFADVIVDLFEYFKPCLCICDAVTCMEGNGPTQGTPRDIGCLIVSKNGHLLDLIGARIIGVEPGKVPTLAAAVRRGLVSPELTGYSVYGSPDEYAVSDFKAPPAQSSVSFHLAGSGVIGKAVDKAVSRILTPFPKLSRAECVGCGKCRGICPANAITMNGGKPDINRKVCIHCFCCQEFCPVGAMKVGRGLIVRMLVK